MKINTFRQLKEINLSIFHGIPTLFNKKVSCRGSNYLEPSVLVLMGVQEI